MYQHTVTLRSLRDPDKKQRVVIRYYRKDYPSVVFQVREQYGELLKTHEIRKVRSIEVR